MKNKLLILFLLVSGLAFGQSVPNTNTFSLDSVRAVIGGTSLTDCFSRAVAADFDATYVGSKDRLSNFRNYTVSVVTYPSGKYISAVSDSSTETFTGHVYVSTDYGVSFYQITANQLNFVDIGMDTTGQYQTAVVNGGYIFNSNDWGQSWVQRGTLQSWKEVSVNATGQYQTAVVYNGNIYNSTDYGVTWTAVATIRLWKSIDVSPSGQYQVAGEESGYVWYSSDYGANWTQTSSISGTWNTVTISTGSVYIYAANLGDGIYKSVDNGATWTQEFSSLYVINSISCSPDGSGVIAGLSNNYIIYNLNYGISGSWIASGLTGDARVDYGHNGYEVASIAGVGLYYSTDGGSTWALIYSSAQNWTGISVN